MGLLEKIFPNYGKKIINAALTEYFKTLTAYTPSFSTFQGGIYEMDLTRACVHSFASMCGKLKPEIQGNAYKKLEKILQFKPNPWMNTYQYIYRIATILSVDNTAFIIPLYGEDEKTIIGFYPILPQRAEVFEYMGEEWLRYTFANGQRSAIEVSRVGIMTNFQYKDDLFGSDNSAISPTLNLMSIQSQGMEEAVKKSAIIRFLAMTSGVIRPDDMKELRKDLSKMNLDADENDTGIMIFDQKFKDVKQIDSKQYVIDADQMKQIKENAFNYFGTNESILQNKYTEDEFNAYYEGKIEPFAVQLSLVHSNMLYTSKEIAYNNQLIFSANRLQYASNKTKLLVTQQLYDRGLINEDQAMDIWNLPHLPGGDRRRIRGEYVDLDEQGNKVKSIQPADPINEGEEGDE